jgi:hypothetical protein
VQTVYPVNTVGCANAAAITTNTISVGAGSLISDATIKLEQPGNTLRYTNANLDTYKWGYDSVTGEKSHYINDQQQQVFTPSSKFLTAGNSPLLDTANFWYWVMVNNTQGLATCKSKIYYNGPYSIKSLENKEQISESILAIISPNPNNGNFYVTIQGNIFGDVHVTIINTLGQAVYETTVEKSIGIQSYPISAIQLDKGLFTVQLNSNTTKLLSTKLIIAR